MLLRMLTRSGDRISKKECLYPNLFVGYLRSFFLSVSSAHAIIPLDFKSCSRAFSFSNLKVTRLYYKNGVILHDTADPPSLVSEQS